MQHKLREIHPNLTLVCLTVIMPGNIKRNLFSLIASQAAINALLNTLEGNIVDVVTRDYSKLLTADEVFENVRKYARNGSIITFHDSLKSIGKLKTALPMSLEWLRSQGYEFKAFDENMSWSRHLK